MTAQPINTFSIVPKYLTAPVFEDNIMVRYGVPGDGTCFYYSLCAILSVEDFLEQPNEKQIDIGRRFRCNFTQDLTWEEWTSFLKIKGIQAPKIKNMEQLKHKLCSYKIWADEPVIQFIMYKLHINLLFLDEQLNKLYCGVSEPESYLTAIIYWINKSHFEPLGRLNALDVAEDRVAVQFQFVKDRDHEFIAHLAQKYGFQCHV
jgi:hypothetical protein